MLLDSSLETVQAQIIEFCPRLSPETVSILNAVGRVSAEEYRAGSDLPAQNQSAVDGYAVAEPIDGGSSGYSLVGNALLGDNPLTFLKPGEAMQVKTGSNLPPGAIAVVPHEKTEIQNDSLIPLEVIKVGNNVKKAGEDYVHGELLIPRNTILTPGHISLMAAFGMNSVSVYRKPRVAVLGLSPNVVPWQTNPLPGQTRDSNTPLITALVKECGGEVVESVLTGVDHRSVGEIGSSLLEKADIVILTGGTYAEDGNEARLLMEQLGADLLYWDVPIQPGSHTGAGVIESRILFALSGNPAACGVGYHLFVAPAVRAMQGLIAETTRLTAQCTNGFPKKSGSRRFIRGQVRWENNSWQVTVLEGQKPSMLRSLVDCNALIDMPASSPPINKGQDVSILVLKTF